jgi:hypothetical protein
LRVESTATPAGRLKLERAALPSKEPMLPEPERVSTSESWKLEESLSIFPQEPKRREKLRINRGAFMVILRQTMSLNYSAIFCSSERFVSRED